VALALAARLALVPPLAVALRVALPSGVADTEPVPLMQKLPLPLTLCLAVLLE
jgi:hypothetical protein